MADLEKVVETAAGSLYFQDFTLEYFMQEICEIIFITKCNKNTLERKEPNENT